MRLEQRQDEVTYAMAVAKEHMDSLNTADRAEILNISTELVCHLVSKACIL